jgi:hypothetical protein
LAVVIFAIDEFGYQDSESDGTLLFFCPNCAPSEGFELTTSSGDLFALISFDSGWLFNAAGVITVTGTFADNSTIVLQLTDIGGWFSNTTLDNAWVDLKSVIFEGVNTSGDVFNSVGFDNIVVDAVPIPIPAAVWLFGSALAGLGWMRRKQTV